MLILCRDPGIADVHDLSLPLRHKTHDVFILSSPCFPTVFFTRILGRKPSQNLQRKHGTKTLVFLPLRLQHSYIPLTRKPKAPINSVPL